MPEYRDDPVRPLCRHRPSESSGFGLLGPDLRYLFADSTLAVISGSPREGLVGRSIREAQAGWANVLEPLCRTVLETGRSPPEFAIGPVNAAVDPTQPVWQGRLNALTDSAGFVLAVSLVVEPLEPTRRPHSPAFVSEREAHLFGALEMLSHDYRNRLAPILSAAQMVRKYGVEKPEVLLWAGTSIEHQVREMTDDMNDLIDLAQLILGKIEWHMHDLDLNPILHRVGEIAVGLAYKLDKRLNIDLDLQPSTVFGDPARIEQALRRLYRHVIESAAPGTVVESSVQRDGDHVVIKVGDSAPGALDQAPKWSYKPPFDTQFLQFAGPGGFEPGFAFANQVIRQHGGSVSRVDLGLERGVAIVVRIPSLTRGAEPFNTQGREAS